MLRISENFRAVENDFTRGETAIDQLKLKIKTTEQEIFDIAWSTTRRRC
jgi:hypothetical protein